MPDQPVGAEQAHEVVFEAEEEGAAGIAPAERTGRGAGGRSGATMAPVPMT